MYARELFELKPGTLIKGIRLKNNYATKKRPDSWGRFAYLNVAGWQDKFQNGLKEIRTPFYKTLGTLTRTCKAREALELLNDSEFPKNIQSDDEADLRHIGWLSFKFGDLVGVHLGEFAIMRGCYSATDMIVYSKILNSIGETGYLVLGCESLLENELELV